MRELKGTSELVSREGQWVLMLFLLICSLCFTFPPLQDQEENKGATSWPEFYIDQLNSMAAVSISPTPWCLQTPYGAAVQW